MNLDSGVIAGIIIAVVIFVVVVAFLSSAANIVQQGYVGVVKTLGEFKSIRNPGLAIIFPIAQTLVRVDMREIPRPGDRQEVITKDNVVVAVNATIFTQVVDAKQALFSVSNFDVAIDALARTALRSVIGTLSLDEALSERERINTDVQQQMEVVTDKWGIRINRIEIVEITPPAQILQALALQKQADQEKRARILQSEGQQLSAVNIADGNRQAAIKNAEGERQAAILRAEGNRQAAILEAEGRAQAIQTVYDAIKAADPNPTLVAILQLDTLSKFADSENTKIVIPAESSALLGAAQALRSVLADVPTLGGGGELVPAGGVPRPADLPTVNDPSSPTSREAGLAALTAEIVACRACPRLVAWRELVAREKVARHRERDVLGPATPRVRGPGRARAHRRARARPPTAAIGPAACSPATAPATCCGPRSTRRASRTGPPRAGPTMG